MKLTGGISIDQSGLAQSIRAMHMQTELMGISSENITGFDKIGYQRKEAVVSSFAEILGVHALSESIDDKVGRIINTKNPLDFALSEKGYFQLMHKDGSIELTRDGRFKLGTNGELLGLEGQKVLSAGGKPIVLPVIPDKLEDIKVTSDGRVSVFNHQTKKLEEAGTIAVVSADGAIVPEPAVKQAYAEASNVSIAQEFIEMVPVRRNFEANRQLFMLQNSNLSRAIQELGRS